MQRKSAYFLFLAVLTMLVIGVVMLFSTAPLRVMPTAMCTFSSNAKLSGSGSGSRF